MNKFRGQYMDMVHSSSDVHVANKPNHAGERPVKEPRPVVNDGKSSDLPEWMGFSGKLVKKPSEPEMAKEVDEKVLEAPELSLEENDAYETPFLPNVEVEKRPLGGSPAENTRYLFGIDKDAGTEGSTGSDQLKLPADDSGKGELEPELPSGEENETPPAQPETDSEPKSEPEPEPKRNAIIEPDSLIEPTEEPVTPFSHAIDDAKITSPKKHLPVWGWILIFALIIAVGVGAGVLVFMMGWLG